jgi:hypothetical protein
MGERRIVKDYKGTICGPIDIVSRNLLAGAHETTKNLVRIIAVQAGIRSEYLPNRSRYKTSHPKDCQRIENLKARRE